MTLACTKMGSIFFIIITFFLMLLSSQRTHILSADALFHPAGNFHFYVLSENRQENDNQIKKISGQDENDEKGLLIVEKFRALIGLSSFQTRRPSNGDSEFLSPSPSPSPNTELEAPSPLPFPHVFAHPFPPRHHSHFNPSAHKFQHEDRGRAPAILASVLVSVGVATVICALGLIWFFRKCRNHARKPKRTMPLCSTNGGSGGTNENSSSQVGLNSAPDLFYLNALGDDIDQYTCSLKQTCETVNTSSNHSSIPKSAIHEKMELSQEVMSSGYDNASSSSTKEILSIHEDVESVKHESDSDGGVNKVVITMERHSSETESFHSFADSHSSNVRLSNASAASVTETVSPSPRASHSNSLSLPIPFTKEIPYSPQTSKIESPQSPFITRQEEQNIETCPQRLQATRCPPPPPPPPPTLQMPLYSLHSLTSSSTIPSDSPLSSSLRNSHSNSALNRSGENESSCPLQPSPARSSSTVPPPPCPPPPFKGNITNVKTPPPPPSQLPQFTPLGKDGAPLPKLKPLHWDKVRAAPDGTMVWDKLGGLDVRLLTRSRKYCK